MLLLLNCENIFNICLTFYSVLDYGSLFALYAYYDEMEWRVVLFSFGNVLICTTVILPCDLEENFVVQLSVKCFFRLISFAKLSYFSY